MGKVLGEFLVIAARSITDPTEDRRGNQNFTLKLLTNSFPPDSETFKRSDARTDFEPKSSQPNKLGLMRIARSSSFNNCGDFNLD